MVNFSSGKFHDYKKHHPSWLQLFVGKGVIEIWFGNRWYSWSK